jgi:rubredoxin-NAD+ reductase
MAPLTIIGTGMAGYSVARQWRRLDPDSPLRIITRDDGAMYSKPMLSKALQLGKDAEGLRQFTAAQMAETLKAEILTDTQVTHLAPAEHKVLVDDRAYEYSQLVLAIGAEVARVPVEGSAADRIMSVNDLVDYARFRAALKPGARVLLIGAGLIGSEFANDLAAGGYSVQVVDPAGWPLPRLLPEALGRAVQDAMVPLGVTWHLGTTVHQLDLAGEAMHVRLSNQQSFEVDAALMAVGLRPRLGLAKTAGIDCGIGIRVDRQLRTSQPDIFALGDCVEIGGRLMPYIQPISLAAKPLAEVLAGRDSALKLPAMPVIVKTPACPVIVCASHTEEGHWDVQGTAPDYEAVFRAADGRPLGFALTGAATSKRLVYAQQMPAVME